LNVIHPLRHTKKALLVVATVASLVAGFGASSAAAKNTTPCWKTLINDWYDGRIDGIYPIHCYRDALKHLPADVDQYSSARDDIKQALQKRITQGSKGGGTKGGGASTGGSSGGGSGGGGGNGGGGSSGGSSGSSQTSNPINSVFNAGKPSKATSVPIPLLVLGGVALLLMAAGGAGFLARRTRMRRDQLATAADLVHDNQ
jgi:hypothetical protein